jgi:Dolichyl-phosphate-mannose-protein mannosyltransferase
MRPSDPRPLDPSDPSSSIAALLAIVAGIAGSLALMWGRFAAGGALFIASLVLTRWPVSIWAGEAVRELSPRGRRAALFAVCALAVFFRVYRLNQPGLWGDDALNGLLAYDILDGKIHSPFQIIRHSYSSFHALSNYPIAAAFWLFGPDLTTLRLPGIVLSALCVPLFYATLAPLFGSTVALLAALFHASSPPQLIHAKELVQVITGQFFQLAGMCLLVRGMTAGRNWLVAAAGLPLALCVYTYHSARLAPIVAIAFVFAVVWERGRPARRPRRQSACAAPTDQRAGRPRSQAVPLAAALLVFLLALLPAALGYVRNPDALVQRVGDTSIWPLVRDGHTLEPLWESASRTLLAFHYQQGPEYHWFGIGTDPAVNVVIGFLLVQGLAQSLLRWREARHLLLLVWFAVGIAPGVLSTGAPRLYRAFLATPPIYAWAALAVARLLAVSAAGRSRRLLRVAAAGLVAAVPLIDFNYYFYRVYTHPQFRWFQGERIVEMARTLRDAGPGWTGYLLADTFDVEHETLRFLSRAWGLRLVDVSSLSDVLPLRMPPERGALFIMSDAARGAAPAIAYLYPGGELIERREPAPRSWWFDALLPLATTAGEPQVSAAFYPVGRAAAEAPRLEPRWGLSAEYEVAGRMVERHEPYPFYFFHTPAFSNQFDAVWRGRLTVPEPGPYQIDVDSNASATLRIDSRTIGPGDLIPAGEHRLRLEVTRAPPRFRLAIKWRGPDGTRELIPPGAFSPPAP